MSDLVVPQASCSDSPALQRLWTQFHNHYPTAQLGGIQGNKPGYHNCRYNLVHGLCSGCGPGDYSLQRANDQMGNDFYGSAIDLTFGTITPTRHLQRTITQRLINATLAHPQDPRMFLIREFFGSTDGVNVVGLDVSDSKWPNKPRWVHSDDSHLWHVHISFYRRWNNANVAIDDFLGVLIGSDHPAVPSTNSKQTFAADVSQWQGVAANHKYGRPWLIFRCIDRFGRVDDMFADNWAYFKRSGMTGCIIYSDYVPGVDVYGKTHDAVHNQPGDTPDNFAVMIDVESWAGTDTPVHGDHSPQINHIAEQFASWLDDQRRVIAYANETDMNNIYPGRHHWIHWQVADWGAQRPNFPAMIGWQYTNGTNANPTIAGWPRASEPFGHCDHNNFDMGPNELARRLGIDPKDGQGVPNPGPPTKPPPAPGPDPGPPPKPPPPPPLPPNPPPNPLQRGPSTGTVQPLGCGTYRAFIYDRGGTYRIGEISPLASVIWSRIRDDISTAQVITSGFGPDCCEMLSHLHSMRNELVILRDGVRVWEGPVTQVIWQKDHVEINAQDVMYYLFRRILREGYDDRYIYKTDDQGNNISTDNRKSVVVRATLLAVDGLARDDPNVAPYITYFDRDDDALEARFLRPMQKTVWEEIDDLAAHGGLDYVVVGRRIMLWDTHNCIGRQPVWDDSAFLANPVITEYGSGLATFAVVSDTEGNFGPAGGKDPFYGLVEILNTTWASKGPPDKTKGLKNDRNDACGKYHEARKRWLNEPGLTKAQAEQLHLWEVERYGNPGPSPDRQQWLDAHITRYRTRANDKKSAETAMNSAKTDCDNARNDLADNRVAWDNYMDALRSQAVRMLEGRDPAPVRVRIPDSSALNPDLAIGINELVPGIWIPLRSNATCRVIQQWQKLDVVTATATQDQGEIITVSMSPAPSHGREPVDVTPTN